MNIDENDYLSFYYAGLNVIQDLPNLYNSSLSPFPFRYLPLSAYFFTPFSFLGLRLGYFFFQLFNFLLNILIIYLIYKIIQIYKTSSNTSNFNYKLNKFRDLFDNAENESILHQSAVFLIMLAQFMNYFLGQVNIIVTVFILSSLYCFLKNDKKYDFLGGFLIGFGIQLKPVLIFILPFLIYLNYNKETKKFSFKIKNTLIRLMGSIILVIISGSYFLIFPETLKDFIDVNLVRGFTVIINGGLEINPSFSLTRVVIIISNLFNLDINGFLVLIIITILILGPIYFLYIRNSNQPSSLIDGYLIGILVMMIVYFDTWPHHLIVLVPFLIFFLLFHKNFEFYNILKYCHYLLAVLTLVFWGIFYLTYEIIPFNIGGLVLLMLVYFLLITYYKKA
ncbi:MAG: glycosyltransferase 87 family protein [Candidatus Hermodarchaeota archaeon]